MTTVCLAMIVRDESEVIARCLNSIKPFVSAYAIVDTGSEDDTIEKILETMKGVKGEVVERPWGGMAKSRNDALGVARTKGCDYILMMDADDVWVCGGDFTWGNLEHGAYQVKLTMGGQSWYRPVLMRSDVKWRYTGAAHEYLVGGGAVRGKFHGAHIEARPDGHRRKTEGREKYNRIAAILEEDLANDPSNNRNKFYLAQSYRDAGRFEEALEWYLKRAKGGGWPEEVWCALLEAAKLKHRLKYPLDEVLAAFEAAHEYRPTRVEALAEAAFIARQNKRKARAFMYASAVVDLPATPDILFADESAHWKALDEYAVNAHHIGRIDIAIEANMRLLKRDDVPQGARKRIQKNLDAAAREGERLLKSAT